MKGLEVAESFFREWALPYLTREHPELVECSAAGRIFGSDVLGADDEISKDHNWGPQFTLFLTETDFVAYGPRLAEELTTAAPNPWKGYRLAGAEDQPVHVVSIRRWFGEHFGLYDFPMGPASWAHLDESSLYFLRHGAIWMDTTDEFGLWRSVLSGYPEAIKTRRLAEECFRVWHYGEYNFVQRMVERLDALCLSLCWGQFLEGVMRITLLLNDDYTPYWKWLPHEFRKQKEAARLEPLMTPLLATAEVSEQVVLVKEICGIVRQTLEERGVITGAEDKPYLLPLLNAHNELKARAARLSSV